MANHFIAAFADELAKTASMSAWKKLPEGTRGLLKTLGLWTGVDYALTPAEHRSIPKALRSAAGFMGGEALAGRALKGKGRAANIAGRIGGGLLGSHALERMAKADDRPSRGMHPAAAALYSYDKHAAAPRSFPTPQSSNVAGFRYDPKTQQLFVTYKGGGTYRYNGVPNTAFKKLRKNKSVGKTINRTIKGGGYEYEKVAKRKHKNYKCKFCKDPATKGVIWAEGRAIVPCCDKHLGKGKASISEKPDLIRDLTKTSSEPTSLGQLAAGGILGGVGAQVGAAAATARESARILKENPLPAEGSFFRNALNLPKSIAVKKQLTRDFASRLGPVARTGGLAGAAAGVFLGYQLAKSMEGSARAERGIKQLLGQTKTSSPENPTAQERFYTNNYKTPSKAKKTPTQRYYERKRRLSKIAGGAKKQVTWNGVTMKLEYLTGDERSGVNGATGKSWSRTMKDNYGYMPGTYGKGADGEAIDVYFSPKPNDAGARVVYKIRQKKKTGEYDEDKFMVGYASGDEAKKAFLRNMPEWAFDSMTGMSMGNFRKKVGQ